METLLGVIDVELEDFDRPVYMLHGSQVKVGDEEKEYLELIPVFADQNIAHQLMDSQYFHSILKDCSRS